MTTSVHHDDDHHRPLPPAHPGDLLRLCGEAYRVTPRAVLGHTRDKDANAARQLLMLLLHERCGWSATLIGRKLGRHHSTVLHGIAQARDRLALPDGADQDAYRYVLGESARCRQRAQATAQNGRIPRARCLATFCSGTMGALRSEVCE